MDSTTSSTVNRQNTSATENSQNVLNNNNQQKSPTVSAHKNTVAPFISGTKGVQTTNVQRKLGDNQAQGVYQQCNYHGMQQFHCSNPYGVQRHNVNQVVNQNNQQFQHQATRVNYQQTQRIGYAPNTSNQYVNNPTGSMQSGLHVNPAMSQIYQSATTQSWASKLNINRAVPNSNKVQRLSSTQNIRQNKPQTQPPQTSNAGYMTNRIGDTSNQYVLSSTGSQRKHANPAIYQSYPTVFTQNYVSGENGVTTPSTSIANSYGVQQKTMQYQGNHQNQQSFNQQNQHQATQLVYQPSKNNMFDKIEKVTTKQGFVYSNQVNPTQGPQSNFVAINQIQSGPQNLQQHSYSDSLNTTTKQQTNPIAQHNQLNYNYQPNPQQHTVMNASSLNLPSRFFKTPSSQTPSSLPQTSTRNASNKQQYTGSDTDSL